MIDCLYIAHRINTIKELKEIPNNYGVEIDLRDNKDNKIKIVHDPFLEGEDFEEYLKIYNHAFIILNIKSEGIEYECIRLLNKYKINNYFFLDCSIPMINKLKKITNKIAIRLSELEPINLLENFKNDVEWVWIDCFTNFILTETIYKKLKEWNIKICLVSPELQGRQEDLENYDNIIINNKFKIDAICRKIYNIK